MTKPGGAWSVALAGMQGVLVEVEVALASGLPRTIIIGLPDSALYEARDRCRAAISAVGLTWPSQLVTINLTPANMPKGGSHFDLAIITATLAAAGHVPASRARSLVLFGELGLDGRVRGVRGLLPGLLAAKDAGFATAVVPACQQKEAELVAGLTVWGVETVRDLIEVLHGRPCIDADLDSVASHAAPISSVTVDLSDVAGQPDAKWALEVAAAGRHHLYFHGPPGVGKTMLAERLPTLLPDLEVHEAMEVAAVRSLAGIQLPAQLDPRPPYSAPHHSATMASLIGGGQRMARPGAISLAHRGVLFLDEAPEFGQHVLDSLRTPLESGRVTITRSAGMADFPAQFQLVLAANPCPCGHHNSPTQTCRCSTNMIRRYTDRLSGPVLDRIDIQHRLRPLNKAFLSQASIICENSDIVRGRVLAARQRQRERLAGTPWQTNGEVPGPYLRSSLPLPADLALLNQAVIRGQLSARGVDKVLRLAWTLADLAEADRPEREHIQGALQMRRGAEQAAVA